MNRIARLAAVAVLGAGLALAAPATPAAAAACPETGSGVTVVVDFAGLGGGVVVRCAPGDPATGLAALTGAGFGFEFVPRQPGLVCRIDGLPNPCNGALQDAHWSYWHAERGGSWQFSTRGAGTFDPAPGTVEGWAFGAADQPGVPPPAPPPAPPPPPDDDDPPAEGPSDRDPPGDQPPGDADPPAGGGDASADRDPPAGDDDQPADRSPAGEPSAGASTGPPSPGAAGPTATGGTAVPAVPGDPAARTSDEAGGTGLAGLLITATLVAALAAVGIWTARRRRRGARTAGDELASDTAADG